MNIIDWGPAAMAIDTRYIVEFARTYCRYCEDAVWRPRGRVGRVSLNPQSGCEPLFKDLAVTALKMGLCGEVFLLRLMTVEYLKVETRQSAWYVNDKPRRKY